MIVGIDGNEANFDLKVGVHQMAFEILWGLYKLEDIKKEGNKYIIYLKNPPNSDLPKEKSYWQYKIIQGKRIWIVTKLMPELILRPHVDVFLALSHYLPPFARVPMVCCITDLGYLKFSGQFRKYDFWQLKAWTAISVIVSKYIIAISNSTKQDIVRHYPFAKNKVQTIYLGSDEKIYNKYTPQKLIRETLNNYRITKKYILFLSTLKPSKNVEGLLEAFKLVRKHHSIQLVIGGKKGWLYDSIFKKVKELSLEKDVVFTDWLPDKERSALMSGAKIFVLPSYWEGFGIDVLNAFSSGVPVVVSSVASLPEVAGKAGFYVNPSNPKEIAKQIENILNMNPTEYTNLVGKGFLQLQKFSWDKTAEAVLVLLEKTVN